VILLPIKYFIFHLRGGYMKFMKIIVILFLSVLMVNIVEATGIGISPPRVFAENLLRGSHFEKTVELSKSDVGEELKVTVQVDEQFKGWISTDRGLEFTFPKDANTLPITIIIDVPKDAANGEYKGNIRIRLESLTKKETGKIGSSVAAGVVISINIDVTGKQVLDYTISSIKIPSTEEDDPINIFITIDNKGNVKAKPTKVQVEVFDKFQQMLLLIKEITDIDSVDPFIKEEIS